VGCGETCRRRAAPGQLRQLIIDRSPKWRLIAHQDRVVLENVVRQTGVDGVSPVDLDAHVLVVVQTGSQQDEVVVDLNAFALAGLVH